MAAELPPIRLSLGKQRFATTEWSVVLAAAEGGRCDASDALARLCSTYWYPLYVYVRHRVNNVHDAQDLTQAFFCQLLEKQSLGRADPSRGRFRTFLITALKNFLANEWRRRNRKKRGGKTPPISLDLDAGESWYRMEPCHQLTPEVLFDRRWVLTMLDQVLDGLRAELAQAGKQAYFEQLKESLAGKPTEADYKRAAEILGITPAAAKQAAYRMRKRYRQLFRQEVLRTVIDEADVDDEIARLLKSLSS